MRDYPLLNLFWTMLWFFLWILWIFLLVRIIGDVFRSHDLSGLRKAAWLILILVLPFVGVFVYLVVRGSDMHTRDAKAQDDFRSYLEQHSGRTWQSSRPIDEARRAA